MLLPVKPRCSPKLIIVKMIYAPGSERKQQSETVLIRRHLREKQSWSKVKSADRREAASLFQPQKDERNPSWPNSHVSLSAGSNYITINPASLNLSCHLISFLFFLSEPVDSNIVCLYIIPIFSFYCYSCCISSTATWTVYSSSPIRDHVGHNSSQIYASPMNTLC